MSVCLSVRRVVSVFVDIRVGFVCRNYLSKTDSKSETEIRVSVFFCVRVLVTIKQMVLFKISPSVITNWLNRLI